MPDRVALLLPGLRYSAERPLLHFAGAVFEKYGWATREVAWPERPPPREDQDLTVWSARLRSFVQAHVGRILEQETAPDVALVGGRAGLSAAGRACGG